MKKFFSLDNPFMIFMSHLTDVIVLNVVCLICCIPVVTIGASITAMHYVTLKMVKEEEGYIVKGFFKSFKQNFKQATIIWLCFLAITAVFFLDFRLLKVMNLGTTSIWGIVITSIYLFVCLTTMYVFPVLSRFENSVRNTLKNAFFMSVLHIIKTIVMAIIYVLPYILLPLHVTMIAVFLLIGAAGPAYINSYIWKSIFKKYEPEEEEIIGISEEN